jgi:hypothetical protein
VDYSNLPIYSDISSFSDKNDYSHPDNVDLSIAGIFDDLHLIGCDLMLDSENDLGSSRLIKQSKIFSK